MLLEKLKRSSAQIKESNNYEDLSATRDKLKRLDESISKLNYKVNKCVEMKELLIAHLEDNQDLHFKQIVYTNKNLQIIAKNIENGILLDYRCINDIESVVNEYEDNLKDYWKSKYTLKVANTLSILELLEKLYILDDRMVKILEVKNKISRIRSSWPFSENDIKIMDQGIEEANKMIMESEINKNIQSFLQKASIGEATILDLNDEIICWVKDYGFANRVKLKFV